MKVRQTGRYIIFTVESDSERADLLEMAGDVAGQHYRVDTVNAETLMLRSASAPKVEAGKVDASRPNARQDSAAASAEDKSTPAEPINAEPINIAFDATPMPLRLISNLAETSFEFDGRFYSSVEGFWQGLKFPGDADRERLACLAGHTAKSAGPKSEPGDRIVYEGREVVVGTVDHWALMERASRAKFEQDDDARAALVSTGSRPLVHKVPIDSRAIPGVIMADIWMRIRASLAKS